MSNTQGVAQISNADQIKYKNLFNSFLEKLGDPKNLDFPEIPAEHLSELILHSKSIGAFKLFLKKYPEKKETLNQEIFVRNLFDGVKGINNVETLTDSLLDASFPQSIIQENIPFQKVFEEMDTYFKDIISGMDEDKVTCYYFEKCFSFLRKFDKASDVSFQEGTYFFAKLLESQEPRNRSTLRILFFLYKTCFPSGGSALPNESPTSISKLLTSFSLNYLATETDVNGRLNNLSSIYSLFSCGPEFNKEIIKAEFSKILSSITLKRELDDEDDDFVDISANPLMRIRQLKQLVGLANCTKLFNRTEILEAISKIKSGSSKSKERKLLLLSEIIGEKLYPYYNSYPKFEDKLREIIGPLLRSGKPQAVKDYLGAYGFRSFYFNDSSEGAKYFEIYLLKEWWNKLDLLSRLFHHNISPDDIKDTVWEELFSSKFSKDQQKDLISILAPIWNFPSASIDHYESKAFSKLLTRFGLKEFIF
ncbi:hypothetical protein J4403_04125 [Candidatus Woesearchaeota archaeon]|nr:hypothetical protein [Candidatus Woesearchaeota archaeon]